MKIVVNLLEKLRPIRFLIAAFVCTLLFISSAYPAAATTSQPTDSEASLNQIQEKTDEAAKSNPSSFQEIESDTEGGLNLVQGKADQEKMSTPENSQDATTVKEKIENILSKITGSDE